MSFNDFFYRHFPHRWLDKNAPGTKRLFEGIFLCLDYAESVSGALLRNAKTSTAIELIPDLEDEYGIAINPSDSIEIRRAKIIAKKRAQDWPITKSRLYGMLDALGIHGEIINDYNAQWITLVIEENRFRVPFGEIYDLLDDNIRAHISLEAKSISKVGEAGAFVSSSVLTNHITVLEIDTDYCNAVKPSIDTVVAPRLAEYRRCAVGEPECGGALAGTVYSAV